MSDVPEPSGDYGYDLVHGDLAHDAAEGAVHPPAREEPPRPGAPPPARAGDLADDLSYDESHGF